MSANRRLLSSHAAWLGALLLGLLAFDGRAADLHSLWKVKGTRHTVYLLGSVHVLRADDKVLPAPIVDAFNAARVVVMELDLAKAMGDGMMGAMISGGMLPAEQTLEGALGSELTAAFAAAAKPLGLDLALMSRFQPWLAAITFTQVKMMSLGYTPDAGVDIQLARRAAEGGKRVVGLETPAQQFALFSRFTLDEQRAFVRRTLSDANAAESQLGAIVDAWKVGDAARIQKIADEEFRDFPGLKKVLLSDRNRAWLPAITALLDGDGEGDAIVVVGVLHLVGADGVVSLLRERGYAVAQQ